MKYIMSLDQGTTSSRCILFDERGRACATARRKITQYYPQPAFVEHDAEEILQSVIDSAREALTSVNATCRDVAAIGITNQRETTVVWDKSTGKPLYNAIVWQCRRTADAVDELNKNGLGKIITDKTGLVPDAYFSATKIRWILDNVPGASEKAKNGELCFGNIDSWLIYNLTGGKRHVTDRTNASRTMLFNIHTLQWDDELLGIFDIPRSMLPEVLPSSSDFGSTVPSVFGGEIPITGVAGDQQSALFGQGCFDRGDVKTTYGTGCFMLMNTGSNPVRSQNGLITTVAATGGEDVQYALEGSAFIAGAAMQWLKDELGLFEDFGECRELALSVEDTAGGYIVPAFTGLGTPYWQQHARGIITGITGGFSKAHLARATMQSLAYQAYDILKAMEKDAQLRISSVKVDGGASCHDFLMQFQSDLLESRVVRPENVEATALGAAYLAGLGAGVWQNRDELLRLGDENDTTFVPDKNKNIQPLIDGWHKAVKCALYWAEL